MDLSVLIAARNEMWLKRTIEDVLANARGETEVIAVLDGAWADPPIEEHPRVTLIHKAVSIGQRAAVNLAAKLSTARYVMKLDAHCSVAEGFDRVLVDAGDALGHDVTQIPRMFNLHVFDWQCQGCGERTYQGPTPTMCVECAKKGTPGGPFERVVVWKPRQNRRTDFARFDRDLHFQYHGPTVKGQSGDVMDVMSSVGACFFMRRERFLELGGLDEAHGSWGQFGTEISSKSWLSGGRQVVNKATWFAHLFRTQGGDFGFPYPMAGSAQDHARRHSQELWLHNKWPGQVRPLSWLIEHFAPVIGWHEPEPKDDKPQERAARLAEVRSAGARFQRAGLVGTAASRHVEVEVRAGGAATAPATGLGLAGRTGTGRVGADPLTGDRHALDRSLAGDGDVVPLASHGWNSTPTKGLVYYTDNRLDGTAIGEAVREQLLRVARDMPIVSVSLTPIVFGHNIVLPGERGQLQMFRQILAGLEALDTDIAFLCEHDVLYHPSHFAFTPTRDDTFYFNQHRWQVRASDGFAVHYRASQTSGCCASRHLLIEHYRKRIAYVEQHGWDRNLGYEPGTNARSRAIDPHGSATWMSPFPNIDIRHGANLSKSKWSLADFRNKANAIDWTESDRVPGWGITSGRFEQFLLEVGHGHAVRERVAIGA